MLFRSGEATAAHPPRQHQGRPKLLKDRAQAPQTDPELMQRLPIHIPQHLAPELGDAATVNLNQSAGVGTVAEVGSGGEGIQRRSSGPHQLGTSGLEGLRRSREGLAAELLQIASGTTQQQAGMVWIFLPP